MANPKANTVTTTTAANLKAVRKIDFATKFARDISLLKEMLGSIRTEKRNPGEIITSKKAVVTLNTTAVAEGTEIPYDAVTYTEVEVGTINFDKQKIGVTIEEIQKHGYESAVQMADDDLRYKIESGIVSKFVTFLGTGTLTTTQSLVDFQSALAEAIGQVSAKWENMDRGYNSVVGFANTLDVYRYLGASNITVQSKFGMNYVEDFLGFKKLFFSGKIPSHTVYATPSENIVLDYIDATNGDFKKAGFDFTTDGTMNLIGVTTDGNTNTMVSELTTITGIGLWCEYLDGIAKITYTPTGA